MKQTKPSKSPARKKTLCWSLFLLSWPGEKTKLMILLVFLTISTFIQIGKQASDSSEQTSLLIWASTAFQLKCSSQEFVYCRKWEQRVTMTSCSSITVSTLSDHCIRLLPKKLVLNRICGPCSLIASSKSILCSINKISTCNLALFPCLWMLSKDPVSSKTSTLNYLVRSVMFVPSSYFGQFQAQE